jgi:hypothetical protein
MKLQGERYNHSMRILTILTLGICASMAMAQPTERTLPAMPTAPPRVPAEEIESSVRSFVVALNGTNFYFSAAYRVFGVKMGYFGGSEWAEEWEKQRGDSSLKIERVEPKVEGETATAQVFYRWQTPLFRSELLQERLALRYDKYQELSWQIVPSAPNATAPQSPEESPRFLNDAASAIANPQRALNTIRAKSTLSNLKQLSFAALQFAQDYDDIYAFAPEYIEKALAPYMEKDPQIWKVPGRDEKYSFNANLSEKNLAQIANPAQTVLFYEGADEKPFFRYDGKAAIAFADGKVALVSPEEATKLIWKP